MKKLLFPVVALLIAIAAIAGIWFALRDGPAAANVPANAPREPQKPGAANTTPQPQQYSPAIVLPDPVVTEQPDLFFAPQGGARLEVRGRVASETGISVAGALVRFMGDGSLRNVAGAAHTDAAGHYRLVAFAAGGSLPDHDRKGQVYAQDAEGGFGVSPVVDLPAAPEADMPEVLIPATGTIRGRVLDDNGAGADGVVVIIRSADTHDALSRGTRSTQVQHQFLTTTITTDQRGEYLVKGLRPGRYYVDADRSWHGIKKQTAEVTVPPSGTVIADHEVSSAGHLRGVVRDSDGRPVQGAIVRAQGTGFQDMGGERIDGASEGFRQPGDRPTLRTSGTAGLGGPAPCITDSQGRFGWFALLPAKWKVSTMVGESFASREDIAPGAGEIELVVQAAAVVSGIVRGADGGLVESFDVRVTRGAQAVSPFDRVAEDRAFPLRPMGEFRLVNPGAGDRLRFSAPGYMPASLAIAALEPGERRTGLEVTLQPLCELTLTLRQGGAPLDIDPVVLLFGGSLAGQSTTDTSGRVTFPRVAPAAYTVMVIQRDGTKLTAKFDVPGRARAALDLELQPETK